MLREWQLAALDAWKENKNRGIVGAVTGGGKTIFALAAIEKCPTDITLIVVPTVALLEQWWEEAASYFDLRLDEIRILDGPKKLRSGTINIAVLNTASRLKPPDRPIMLVVDECHKAASEAFSKILDWKTSATLGLSATPERPYDDGLEALLVPSLGQVIYQYTYEDALRDGVIVPFDLINVVFDLEPKEQAEYGKLSRSIARVINQEGADSEKAVALLLKRSRLLNLSIERIRHTIRIAARHKYKRVLIFHESIEACKVIHSILVDNGVTAGVYHSDQSTRQRAEMINAYRSGEIGMLVTCRALDEGFNVPETEVGIIAASTATRRQRIQRLGRVLRPAEGKTGAIVYTLVATEPEISRLREEEKELTGVASVTWARA